MSDDQINIEINGTSLTAEPGMMLIEVADKAGIRIPRFCYHNKLSVAANCRMCLIEVEKAPKPLPACATPVMDGMKVFTKSPRAIAAQKATMEFLLINHPLDCPICDQGGECELQDVAMGYGGDVSRFSENKRVVADKNLGSLISTDMTRCIHCTRCVRFGQELAGVREMGATGRGEHTRIGTYIEQAVDSEMSGNIIDICPVGALTAKPSKFSARAWEIVQHASLGAHDCMGSNLAMHTFRGKVTRTAPRERDAINECWLSDRDRFSYEGFNSDSRLTVPMIKVNGEWVETDWDTALEATAKGLQKGGADTAWLVSPNATLEEMGLVRQLADGIGSQHVDYRLRQNDFRDQKQAPAYRGLGMSIEALEQVDAALLIGSNVRKEQPIAAHRLRKAWVKGARLMFINTRDFDFHFDLEENIIASPANMVSALAGIAKAALEISGGKAPAHCEHILKNVDANDTHLSIAEHLKSAKNATVILGTQAQMMPYFTEMSVLANIIATACGAQFGYLTEGANSSGAWLAGMLPNSSATASSGMNVQEMMSKGIKSCVLLGVEPEFDMANPRQALTTLSQTDFVVSLTPFVSETMKQYAHVLLPTAPVSETSGTFINVEGRQQSFTGVTQPAGDTRPAWKVLRVLGNLLNLDDFDYVSSEQVRDAVLARTTEREMINSVTSSEPVMLPEKQDALTRIGAVQTYHEDMVVRRAVALQKTHDANDTAVRIHPSLATRLGLLQAKKMLVSQDCDGVGLLFTIDKGIPEDCVWVPAACTQSTELGALFTPVQVEAD